jgi:hypothetical protein
VAIVIAQKNDVTRINEVWIPDPSVKIPNVRPTPRAPEITRCNPPECIPRTDGITNRHMNPDQAAAPDGLLVCP